MSYEYVFHTPRYKPFDKGLIEKRERLLPHAFECHAKDGSPFYTVAGDEETEDLVHKMIESGNTFAVPDLADEVTRSPGRPTQSCVSATQQWRRATRLEDVKSHAPPNTP